MTPALTGRLIQSDKLALTYTIKTRRMPHPVLSHRLGLASRDLSILTGQR
jgi:hypothetical protein